MLIRPICKYLTQDDDDGDCSGNGNGNGDDNDNSDDTLFTTFS